MNYKEEIAKLREKVEARGSVLETADKLKELIDKRAELEEKRSKEEKSEKEKKEKTGWDIWEERLEKRLAIEVRKDNIEQIKSIPEIHFISANDNGIEFADSNDVNAEHNGIAYGDVLEYVSKNKVQERRSEEYKALWKDLS